MKPSIVFSHGIWTDGSFFQKVIPALRAEGHQVMAAQYGLDTVNGDVEATQDRTVHPDLERFAAKRMGAKVTEVASSHVPMLSHPKSCSMSSATPRKRSRNFKYDRRAGSSPGCPVRDSSGSSTDGDKAS